MNEIDVLIEALPYIKKFHSKKILIKYGGHAMIDDEATVKRLIMKTGEAPYLMPENPDFDPIRPERMEILGKVVGSFRRY